MHPLPEYRRKSAPALGAALPGLEGPFGRRPGPDDDDPDDDPDQPDDADDQDDAKGAADRRALGGDQAFCAVTQKGSGLVRTPDADQDPVGQRLQAEITAAARRREAARQRRAALNQARQHGLAQRRATKLRHLDQRDDHNGGAA